MTPESFADDVVAEVYRMRGEDPAEDYCTDDRITIGEWKAAIIKVSEASRRDLILHLAKRP